LLVTRLVARQTPFSTTGTTTPIGASIRTVTTLQETLAAQVPEKQKKMAELKKSYGSEV
jgi:citrate synthase